MTAALKILGTTENVTGIGVRVGGVMKTVTEGWFRVGGALKQFYAAITVALSVPSVIGRGNSATTINVTSAPVTATVTGGIGAISYVWTRTAPDAHAWTIDEPNSPTTTFSTLCDQGVDHQATFICTVTDSAGQTLASSAVSADCANIWYGGGYPGSGGTPGTPYP